MAIIDQSYFFGELNIAGKSDVGPQLQMFIDEHEPALLADLLGYKLYTLFIAGIAAGSPAQKWVDLQNGVDYTNRSGIFSRWKGLKFAVGSAKKSLIANYVYWHYMQDLATTSTAGGEVTASTPGATVATPARKMISAWNNMVQWNWELVEFLLSKSTDYPDFSNHYGLLVCKSIMKRQNLFNI